jgi:hypothetical protein
MVNKKMIKAVGTDAALFLSVLINKAYYHHTNKSLTDDGFFYETIETMEEELQMSRHTQNRCIEILTEKRCIITQVRGIPAKRHFCLLYGNINNLLKQVCNKFTNCEIPNSYPNNDNGSVCDTVTNLFVTNLQQIKTKDNNKTNYSTSYCGEASASPRKKIKIDRTKPLVIIPEPDKIFSKPIIRKSHFVPKKKSEVVKEIFDYWAKKGLPVHEEKSRSESTAIYYLEELLNGTLFKDRFRDEGVIRKYSVREIKQAIDNFALKARNPDYEPTNKDWLRHVYLNTFFYNPKIGTEEKKSIFLDSLFNKPVMLANSRIFAAKDEVPHITNMLVDWYKRVFRNRIESVGFSIKNRNDCVYAGKELKNFLEENKGRLNLNNDSKRIHGQHDDLSLLAFLLTKAMDKELRENEGLYPVFHTGWLHSERTITERLPKILREERIMK